MSQWAFEQEVTVEKVHSTLERGCIFSGVTDDGKKIRVKYQGNTILPVVGDRLEIKGQLGFWTNPIGKRIQQVDSKVMKRKQINGELVAPWLGRLPNIGPGRAQNLTNHFGHDLAQVLKDISRIDEVAKVLEPGKPALAARIAAQVYAAMAAKQAGDRSKIEEVEFLTSLEKLGVHDTRIANQLWRFMQGTDAFARLKRNPYLQSHLMPWKAADEVGQRILRSDGHQDLQSHPERLKGALSSVWREVIQDGNSAVTQERLHELLRERGVAPDEVVSLHRSLGMLRESHGLIRAPGAAWIEDKVSAAIETLEQRPSSLNIPYGKDLAALIKDAERTTGLTLTAEQRDAIARLMHMPLGILQGGAGVGKTTVMKVLAICWERIGGNVEMGALAGKAALQLSRSASSPSNPRVAHTLARLLGLLTRQADNPDKPISGQDITIIDKTLLIIDEAGMMDTSTFHQILQLLPVGVRLLLAGDDGQLFPIGFGKVFHDLAAEGSRVAKLTKVLRQAEGSEIPLIAAKVRNGETPDLDEWGGESHGVYYIDQNRLETVQRTLRQRGELLVVAAKRTTVDDINETESMAKRSADTVTRRLGPLSTVAVGDPIVMNTNRWAHGLFNGLLGEVTALSQGGVEVRLDGEPSPRLLPEEAQGDVELAYAITCHKAQGSSADAVMVLVENSPLVTREWLYTAITRSKHLVLLVGAKPESIQNAVSRRTQRTTGFKVNPIAIQAERRQATVE